MGEQQDLRIPVVEALCPVEGHNGLPGAGGADDEVAAIERQVVDAVLLLGEVLVARQAH